MASNIELKTYKGGSVTPQDDAIIHQTVIGTNGIFKGCQVTYSRGNVLHIAQGFGMIKGRFFEVYECEVGVVLNSTTGTLQGRLYIHMDLSNTDEPIQLLSETADVLTTLDNDEDVNYNNTSYDMELATFQVSRTGILNLEMTFETIKGASGSGGGASTLQRATAYEKGDFATCQSAPGWVTLYCTQAGETAETEPAEYSAIVNIGETVQDGTCVFTARDVIGELDVLKEMCVEAEDSVATLGDDVQELKDELIKQTDDLLAPVGTIKFMASEDASTDWLRCDGSYISEQNYPELVSVLGQQLPSGDDFKLISDCEVPSQISNGVVYAGRLWVYSYSAGKLYGIDLEGDEEIKVITLSSTNASFSDFLSPTTGKPIALSIVPHNSGNSARLFLAQFISDGTDSSIPTEYSWHTYFLIFATEFTGDETDLTLEPPFKTIERVADTSSSSSKTYYYYPTFASSEYVPYVISKIESGVEVYYCALGTKYNTYGTSSPGGLSWSDANTTASVIYTNISLDTTVYKNQRTSYSRRNRGEIVSLSATNSSSSRYYSIYSQPSGVFAVSSRSYSGSITSRSSTLPLTVAGESKVLATFETNNFPWASVTDAKAGCTAPNLSLPSSAKVFVDAATYLWGKEMFLIFVGTGIIFSSTLEAGSFGYLDTTSVMGVISQFGFLDYSEDEGELYLLGQNTSNKIKAAKINLNTLFDYASDGAWLPLIVSQGVPAYIKAKSSTTE